MKKNKTDSEILDEIYFPKIDEPSPIKDTIYSFSKIIELTLRNSFYFIFYIFIFSIILIPKISSNHNSELNIETVFILILAYIPFILDFFNQRKSNNLLGSSGKTMVSALSFISFSVISFFVYFFNILPTF